MPVPFEVQYSSAGKKGKKSREVVGVLCPTVIAQRLFGARVIPVSMGDAEVDWTKTTAGFEYWNRCSVAASRQNPDEPSQTPF